MLISHPKEGNISEKKLTEHLKNVAELSSVEIKNQNISPTLLSKDKLIELSLIIGLFHDFGKATTWFQEYIRKKRNSSIYTRHSLLSAIVAFYVALYENLIKNGRIWFFKLF